MRKIAILSDNDRRELFRNTADKMGLHDAIVEKDFWVCYTLDCLFHRSPWKTSIPPAKSALSAIIGKAGSSERGSDLE